VSDRDLFANFDRMRRELDELLGGVFERSGLRGKAAGFSPPLDVAYVSDPPMAVVTVELAGVDPNQLDLEVQGSQLTLSGERTAPGLENSVYQQVEIQRGRFRRIVSLAAPVDVERVRASYEAGMLRIELPLVKSTARATAVPIEGRRTR
jgi:HSP20 family protein